MKRLALIAVTLSTAVVAAFGLWAVRAARAGFIQTGAGPYDYNDTANWADTDADFVGNIDGNWLNTLTLTADQTVTLGTDTVLNHGWDFEYAGNFTLVLKGTGGNRLVTLGGNVTYDRSNNNKAVTIGSGANGTRLNVELGAGTITFASGKKLTVAGILSPGMSIGTLHVVGDAVYSGTAAGVGSLRTHAKSRAGGDGDRGPRPGRRPAAHFAASRY